MIPALVAIGLIILTIIVIKVGFLVISLIPWPGAVKNKVLNINLPNSESKPPIKFVVKFKNGSKTTAHMRTSSVEEALQYLTDAVEMDEVVEISIQ